jgi:hypothetical protein
MTRADFHGSNVGAPAVQPCGALLLDVVGDRLQRLAARELSDSELEQHIKDCGHLLEQAMEHGNVQEAEGWQQAMYRAIAARSPARKAQMEAEIERRISEGLDYFNSEHASALARWRAA